jgi:hypothetical protein
MGEVHTKAWWASANSTPAEALCGRSCLGRQQLWACPGHNPITIPGLSRRPQTDRVAAIRASWGVSSPSSPLTPHRCYLPDEISSSSGRLGMLGSSRENQALSYAARTWMTATRSPSGTSSKCTRPSPSRQLRKRRSADLPLNYLQTNRTEHLC